MSEPSNHSNRQFWLAVQCRNATCKKDFPVMVDSKPVAVPIGLEATASETQRACDKIAGQVSGLLDKAAFLQGAKTSASGRIDITPLFQHCPYCGRFYIYSHPDFFMTTENVPKTT